MIYKFSSLDRAKSSSPPRPEGASAEGPKISTCTVGEKEPSLHVGGQEVPAGTATQGSPYGSASDWLFIELRNAGAGVEASGDCNPSLPSVEVDEPTSVEDRKARTLQLRWRAWRR